MRLKVFIFLVLLAAIAEQVASQRSGHRSVQRRRSSRVSHGYRPVVPDRTPGRLQPSNNRERGAKPVRQPERQATMPEPGTPNAGRGVSNRGPVRQRERQTTKITEPGTPSTGRGVSNRGPVRQRERQTTKITEPGTPNTERRVSNRGSARRPEVQTRKQNPEIVNPGRRVTNREPARQTERQTTTQKPKAKNTASRVTTNRQQSSTRRDYQPRTFHTEVNFPTIATMDSSFRDVSDWFREQRQTLLSPDLTTQRRFPWQSGNGNQWTWDWFSDSWSNPGLGSRDTTSGRQTARPRTQGSQRTNPRSPFDLSPTWDQQVWAQQTPNRRQSGADGLGGVGLTRLSDTSRDLLQGVLDSSRRGDRGMGGWSWSGAAGRGGGGVGGGTGGGRDRTNSRGWSFSHDWSRPVLPKPVLPQPVFPQPVLPQPMLPQPVLPEISFPRPNFDAFRNNFFEQMRQHGQQFYDLHHKIHTSLFHHDIYHLDHHPHHHFHHHHHPHHHYHHGTHTASRPTPRPKPTVDERPVLGGERPTAPSPHYETLCRGRHYHARRYDDTVWVTATVSDGSSLDALRRIKSYFMGKNERGLRLRMSRPLRMTVVGTNGTISDTEATIESFVLSAMLPPEYTDNPPSPLDAMLNLTVEPSRVYFVTHFRPVRRPGSPAIYDEYFELQDALDAAGESITTGLFHTAFYETWSDVIAGLMIRPRPGEILIPGVPGERQLMCANQETEREGPQNGIKQCGKSRCPQYEHLERLSHNVELRRIKGGSYITRRAPACVLLTPSLIAHWSLKRYLNGANADCRKYPSSVPYINYVFPSRRASSFCKQTVISAYYLPPNQTLAEPTKRSLRVVTVQDREAYVMKFGGRPTQRIVERKVDELRDFLRREGRCFFPDRYAVAAYDHPFNRPPHLNEVLVFSRPQRCRWSEGNGATTDGYDTTRATSTTSTTSTTQMTNSTTVRETTSISQTTASRRTTERTTEGTTVSTTQGTSTAAELDNEMPLVTDFPPLIEVPLSLETNSVESWDRDLVPYRFSGNVTDFPEDFPTDVL
ncbi:uncharacterized protein [Diadema setosum]|uniref:uncharacterized protein n=1 Tax=Diadema setosum TaxID=31175 RepID=UPI003B3B0847